MSGPGTFESRCVHLHGLAYRAAFPILGNREGAQDVAQEAIARAFSRWRSVSDYAEAWVTRVAVNLALDITRRRRRPPRWFADAQQPAAEDPHIAERLDLQRALRLLSDRQREAVTLRYILGFSEREVAEHMSINPGTVKTHLARGLTQLKATLNDEKEEP